MFIYHAYSHVLDQHNAWIYSILDLIPFIYAYLSHKGTSWSKVYISPQKLTIYNRKAVICI